MPVNYFLTTQLNSTGNLMNIIIFRLMLFMALFSGCSSHSNGVVEKRGIYQGKENYSVATRTKDDIHGIIDDSSNEYTEQPATTSVKENAPKSPIDQQESDLRLNLRATGIRVLRENNHLKLIMPDDVSFESNAASINPNFYKTLNTIASILNEFGNTRIKIYGYTDSQGDFRHNQLLSEDRARSIANYLIGQGLQSSRLYVRGLGDRFSIASNNTEKGRALNRRIQLSIEPLN